ncbi:31844_t:CDS:2, partial [Gigaspora margarita]
NWSIIKILEYVESKYDMSDYMLETLKESFSSTNMKQFTDRLELKTDKREFHITVCRNVTSTSTLQALEASLMQPWK